MIALIQFDKELILTKDKAEELKLSHNLATRIGVRDDVLASMNSTYHYYRDELVIEDGKYYPKVIKEGTKKEPVSDYYVYDRPPEGEFVKVKEGGHLVDLVWFIDKCRIPYRIMEAIRPENPTMNNVSLLLKKVEDKTAEVLAMAESIQHHEFNEKCNVHVGGGMIATYNEVMLKENSCTDELQGELNNGWRIIAVCVQPDQRRPDYILGRYNPKLDVSESENANAKR